MLLIDITSRNDVQIQYLIPLATSIPRRISALIKCHILPANKPVQSPSTPPKYCSKNCRKLRPNPRSRIDRDIVAAFTTKLTDGRPTKHGVMCSEVEVSILKSPPSEKKQTKERGSQLLSVEKGVADESPKEKVVTYPGLHRERTGIEFGGLSRNPLRLNLPPDLHERVRCVARRSAVLSGPMKGTFEDELRLGGVEAITISGREISAEALSVQTGDWGLRWKER